jgi:hypothetical protein
MKRSINQDLLSRIARFDWFSQCGKAAPECPSGLTCRTADSWQNACALVAQLEWENLELDATNETTEFLAYNFPDEDQQWNDLVHEADHFLYGPMQERVRSCLAQRGFTPVPKVVIDSVRWDIRSAIMEDAYRDLNPPRFFDKLLALYEAGHFPCGWENGKYPAGRLIVY